MRNRLGGSWAWRIVLALWIVVVGGMLWTSSPDVPPAIARPEELLGELPPGYRYQAPPETEESLDALSSGGWHEATRVVLRGCQLAATVTVTTWDRGANVAFFRGRVEHDHGVWLPPTDLVAGEAFAGWLTDSTWALIAQRDDVVVSIVMPKYSEGRLLSESILARRLPS